jgi:FkbM family methyltransferase
MRFIQEVLKRHEFEQAPPILLDVGASGGLNPAWRDLAKYSICIAFDADEREMRQTRRASNVYKELYIYNRAVSASPERTSDFYLTKSPPCSSLLAPNTKGLSAWEFADRFSVIKKDTIKTIHLSSVIQELKLERIDWFKTDSQGTDLRLFLSLGDALIRKVLVAEFEPGIMDAYEGEDKLFQLMSSMHTRAFWMSDMVIKGSHRIRKDLVKGFTRFELDYMVHLLKTSPGWAEVTYLSSFAHEEFSKRDYLLGWVCACIKQQHGFAWELAAGGHQRFRDPIFQTLEKHSMGRIRRSYFYLPAYFPLLRRLYRKWKKLGTVQALR